MRIRSTQLLLSKLEEVKDELEMIMQSESNAGWDHDHLGVITAVLMQLKDIEKRPREIQLRSDLGRLVDDNGAIDFQEPTKTKLFQISTANIRDDVHGDLFEKQAV